MDDEMFREDPRLPSYGPAHDTAEDLPAAEDFVGKLPSEASRRLTEPERDYWQPAYAEAPTGSSSPAGERGRRWHPDLRSRAPLTGMPGAVSTWLLVAMAGLLVLTCMIGGVLHFVGVLGSPTGPSPNRVHAGSQAEHGTSDVQRPTDTPSAPGAPGAPGTPNGSVQQPSPTGPGDGASGDGGRQPPPTPTLTPTQDTRAPTATPPPGSPPAPTATPDVHATSATVTLTQASKPISSLPSMSACPTGCTVTAPMGSASKSFSASRAATGGQYYAVDLKFWLSCPDCGASSATLSPVGADGARCTNGPFWVSLSGSQTVWIQCLPSRHPVAANDFNSIRVTAIMQGNPAASYFVSTITAVDCTAARQAAADQAVAWTRAYAWPTTLVAHTTSTSTTATCTPRVGASGTGTKATSTGAVTFQSFAASAAQGLASTRLLAALPNGYLLKSGSATTCAATWTMPDSSHTFIITCQDTGIALYNWSSQRKADLAARLAGESKNIALTVCAATSGVAVGTCSISLAGGNGQTMPFSAGQISVMVEIA